jgi:predicted DNA binding protein
MVTIAEFRVPARDVALGVSFEREPTLRASLEHAITTDIPCVWLSGPSKRDVEAALDHDPTVESYTAVTAGDGEWLYDLDFTDRGRQLCRLLLENAVVLEATAMDGNWRIRLRFPDRARANRVYELLDERDVDVDVLRLCEPTDVTSERIRLTEQQREALSKAFEYGYFDIPRQISMQELADELDISHQALSERLRRAYETLVSSELGTSAECAEST